MRRRARILAVQALYSMDVVGGDTETALRAALRLADHEDEDGDPPELSYASELVGAVDRRRSEIDALLDRAGSGWRVDRMSPLDLQILRVAVAELLARRDDLPAPVVIDEAIEVAREYGGDGSPSFVNGVLDAVARALRVAHLNPGQE